MPPGSAPTCGVPGSRPSARSPAGSSLSLSFAVPSPSCARAGNDQRQTNERTTPAISIRRFIRSLSVSLSVTSEPEAEGEGEHLVVELPGRVGVRELGVGVCAVEPARVGERHGLVAEPVALEKDPRADDGEALLVVLGVRHDAIDARREAEPAL